MLPPPNRLEKLKGKLKDFYSIRNNQWRVIFKWIKGEPHEIRIREEMRRWRRMILRRSRPARC